MEESNEPSSHPNRDRPTVASSLVFGLGTAGLIICVAGVFFYLPWVGFSDWCGNEILSEVRSPDGVLKAVVFSRDCGATTRYSTQVSVLRADQALPNEAGNVFCFDHIDVCATWLNNRTLKVEHDTVADYTIPSISHQLPGWRPFVSSEMVRVEFKGTKHFKVNR